MRDFEFILVMQKGGAHEVGRFLIAKECKICGKGDRRRWWMPYHKRRSGKIPYCYRMQKCNEII